MNRFYECEDCCCPTAANYEENEYAGAILCERCREKWAPSPLAGVFSKDEVSDE